MAAHQLAGLRPSSSATRSAMYWCDAPWNPYLATPSSSHCAGDAVEPRVLRHGGVELRFECGDNRDARHGLPECLDGREVDGIVRRRRRQELPQRVDHAVIHHERAAIAGPAWTAFSATASIGVPPVRICSNGFGDSRRPVPAALARARSPRAFREPGTSAKWSPGSV